MKKHLGEEQKRYCRQGHANEAKFLKQFHKHSERGLTCGYKSKAIYESPLVVSKENNYVLDSADAELVYNGYWFSKKRISLQKIVDKNKNKVNGVVVLKVYKGNVTITSRRTSSNAYSMKQVSFEENKTFNKIKIEKFINFHSKQLNKS